MGDRPWLDPEIKRLTVLRAEGVSYRQVSRKLGRSRSAVASAIRRYIHQIPDLRPSHRQPPTKLRTRARVGVQAIWSERVLTETWAERKARRSREAHHA